MGSTRMIFLAAILFTWGTIEALESNSLIPNFVKDAEIPAENDDAKVAENPTLEVKNIPSFINIKEVKHGQHVVGYENHTLNPGETVIIRSKNYPNRFPRWHKFKWNFQGSCPGSKISIYCPFFKLTRRCRRSFLKVKGGDFRRRYCGTNHGLSASSTTNGMRVKFRSRRGRAKGFECHVTASENCGTVNRASRIIGGEETEVNEYPWQVVMVNNGTNDIAFAGSLYNDRYVITSAYFAKRVRDNNINVDALLGAHDLNNLATVQRISVEQVIVHENYSRATFDNNIGLLKLSHAATLNDRVKPACLPNPSNDYVGVNAIISGWGYTSPSGNASSVLMEAEVQTISNSECNTYYQPRFNITDNMICAGLTAGGVGACWYDFAGPLATKENGKWILIGVASHTAGCALSNSSTGYVRISKYLDWIAENIGGYSTCPHRTAP